jgi:hypothetical protein
MKHQLAVSFPMIDFDLPKVQRLRQMYRLDFLPRFHVYNRAGELQDSVLHVQCTTSHSNKNSPALMAQGVGMIV